MVESLALFRPGAAGGRPAAEWSLARYHDPLALAVATFRASQLSASESESSESGGHGPPGQGRGRGRAGRGRGHELASEISCLSEKQ
jgi:hypothetical protein